MAIKVIQFPSLERAYLDDAKTVIDLKDFGKISFSD